LVLIHVPQVFQFTQGIIFSCHLLHDSCNQIFATPKKAADVVPSRPVTARSTTVKGRAADALCQPPLPPGKGKEEEQAEGRTNQIVEQLY